jgi:hypothetical protein
MSQPERERMIASEENSQSFLDLLIYKTSMALFAPRMNTGQANFYYEKF